MLGMLIEPKYLLIITGMFYRIYSLLIVYVCHPTHCILNERYCDIRLTMNRMERLHTLESKLIIAFNFI